jgi:hypothetical protein
LWEQKMVAKDTSYGSETHRPYLDIERIINVQSACSVNRGHDPIKEGVGNCSLLNYFSYFFRPF